jgi:hypothetical protein
MVGFANVLGSTSIGFLGSNLLVLVNILLLFATICLQRDVLFNRSGAGLRVIMGSNDVARILLLVSTVVFIWLSAYAVNFPDKLVPTIDQWYHYGNTVKALNGNLFSFVPPYYWFYMYAGLFTYGTGLPSINSYMTLLILCPLPAICFYLMCTRFLSGTKALIATFIYSIFSGLGGIYVDYLRLTSEKDAMWLVNFAASKTYDISEGATSFSFYVIPKMIGLSTLFALIYLSYDGNLPWLRKTLLISAVFVVGYLTHVAEIYIFLLVLVLLLLVSRKYIVNPKSLLGGIVLGLAIAAIVDLLAPQKVYLFPYFWLGYIAPATVLLFGIVLLLCFLSFFPLNLQFLKRYLDPFVKRSSSLFSVIAAILFYVLTLGITIWISILPVFGVSLTNGMFPWYFYPIRLGIASFMAIFGAYRLFRTGRFGVLMLSLVFILLAVALERVTGYLMTENMATRLAFFSPVRIVEFAWIGIAILASYPVAGILKQASRHTGLGRQLLRRSAAVLLAVTVIVAGSSSTLYNVRIRSQPELILSKSEIEALSFLQTQTWSNVTVLALGISVNKINDFGGRHPIVYYQPAIFGASSSRAFFDIMKFNMGPLYGGFPTKYFWLSKADASELGRYAKGYFVNRLLGYLPVVYRNDEVTIYELPSFSKPPSYSDLEVVLSPLTESENEVLEMLALANLGYTTRPDLESSVFEKTRILPSDIEIQAQDESSLTSTFADSPGKTVVFNSQGEMTLFPHSGLGPNVYEANSEVFLRTRYVYVSVEEILFYLDLNGASEYVVTAYSNSWRFMNITSYESSIQPSVTNHDTFLCVNDTLPSETCRIYWIMDCRYQPVGWRKNSFLEDWSFLTEPPVNGNVSISGETTTPSVIFNASARNVWQYLTLDLPGVDVSQYQFLILREKIEATSYNLGYLRVVIGGLTYNIRGWTDETRPPGHQWKTYVFDLANALPEVSGSPTPPRGLMTRLFWAGCSTGESGGSARLCFDYAMLSGKAPIVRAELSTIDNFESDNVTTIAYNGNSSAKIANGTSYLVTGDKDYLGVALCGDASINGENFHHEYWQYHWVSGSVLNITSRGDCYIDDVVGVRIDPMFEERTLDGVENPVFSTFEGPFGVFSTILSLDTIPTRQKQVVNGIAGPGGTLSIPTIEISTFYSADSNVAPIAYYTKDGEQVSPCAFSKRIGVHELVYVQIYPYFDALRAKVRTDDGGVLFVKLGTIPQVLNLSSEKQQGASEEMARAILYGGAFSDGIATISTDSFYIPSLDTQWRSTIGWKDDTLLDQWSVNHVGNGTVDAHSDGDIVSVTANGTGKLNIDFKLHVPNVDLSKYHYLIFKEYIESRSCMFGYLRLNAGGYTYLVRGWTSETREPGHPWKIYILDLLQAIPEQRDAPALPQGQVTSDLWWYGGMDEQGGFLQFSLDYVMLTSSSITPNYGESFFSLDLTRAGSVLVNGVPANERVFDNMKTLSLNISGYFNSTFLSAETRIVPPGLNGYAKIVFGQSCNLTLRLAESSTVSLSGTIDNNPLEISVIGGEMRANLTSSNLELIVYMSNARLSISGYTKFEKAFISWPYSIYDPELPVEFTGQVAFMVNVMDLDFSLISKLEVGNGYAVLTEQQVKWNEWDLPWQRILTSPIHLILLISIFSCAIVYILGGRLKRSRISVSLEKVADTSPGEG